MDLFSQAEHAETSQSILISHKREFVEQVEKSIVRLLPDMPRRDIIEASLHRRGAFIEVRNLDEACEMPTESRRAPRALGRRSEEVG